MTPLAPIFLYTHDCALDKPNQYGFVLTGIFPNRDAKRAREQEIQKQENNRQQRQELLQQIQIDAAESEANKSNSSPFSLKGKSSRVFPKGK